MPTKATPSPSPAPILIVSPKSPLHRRSDHRQGLLKFGRLESEINFETGEVFVIKMSGAQGANPPGSYTDTTYSSVPGADSHATATRVDSTQDDKGVPVQLAADTAPKPNESAGLGGPVFGGNEGPDKGVVGSSYTE